MMTATATDRWWQALELPAERYRRALFFVDGVPGPKGSHAAIEARGKAGAECKACGKFPGRPMVIPSHGDVAKAWEKAVVTAAAAEAARLGWVIPAKEAPHALAVDIRHYFRRAQDHFLRGALRPEAPLSRQQDPDADKVLRTTLDGLTSSFWRDDNVVVYATTEKRWGDAETRRILNDAGTLVGSESERYGALIVIQEIPATVAEIRAVSGWQGSLSL